MSALWNLPNERPIGRPGSICRCHRPESFVPISETNFTVCQLLSTHGGREKLKYSLKPSLRRRMAKGMTEDTIIDTMVKQSGPELGDVYTQRAVDVIKAAFAEMRAEDAAKVKIEDNLPADVRHARQQSYNP